MSRVTLLAVLAVVVMCLIMLWCSGCPTPTTGGEGTTTVKEQRTDVQADATTGKTVEQKNISKRLLADNKVGAIKHLYVISPYSGEVIMYSTVAGKVTSSGKRLKPFLAVPNWNNEATAVESLQEDGTYGHSGEYVYWWDTKDVYHQHYLTGGEIVHVSDQPLAVQSVGINLNNTK